MGAPRRGSSASLGSLSLGRGSRRQLHACNFRLNPGNPLGPRERVHQLWGACGSPLVCVCPSRCELIGSGPCGTPNSPQRRRQRRGHTCCFFLQDALGCPGLLVGVCVSVCVSESVSVSVSVCMLVCVCPCELMPLQSCGQRAGCLEAGPRSRQLQPDTGKRGGWPGRCGRGAGRVRTEGSPWHRSHACWCRRET